MFGQSMKRWHGGLAVLVTGGLCVACDGSGVSTTGSDGPGGGGGDYAVGGYWQGSGGATTGGYFATGGVVAPENCGGLGTQEYIDCNQGLCAAEWTVTGGCGGVFETTGCYVSGGCVYPGSPPTGGAAGCDYVTGFGCPQGTGGMAATGGSSSTSPSHVECETERETCSAAVADVCFVLSGLECALLGEECDEGYAACIDAWVMACPEAVARCYRNAEDCYGEQPLEICDQMFVGCSQEAEACGTGSPVE